MRKKYIIFLMSILCIFLLSSKVLALDIPESYLSLISGSDQGVLTNPGNELNGSITDLSGTSTTTIFKIASRMTTFGYKALEFFSSGNDIDAFGHDAGRGLSDGVGNVFIGDSTGTTGNSESTWYGDHNIFMGVNSASNIEDSGTAELNNNIFIGYNAPVNQIMNANNNILIGHNIDLPVADGDYQLNIGNIIYGVDINGSGGQFGRVAIGSTTPFGRFSIQANDGQENQILFVIASSTSEENTTLYTINNDGHHIYGGNTPSIDSCGADPSIIGNDSRGRIIVGFGTVNSCSIIFVSPWSNPPVCHITQETGTTTSMKINPSTSDITIITDNSIESQTISYSCDGF